MPNPSEFIPGLPAKIPASTNESLFNPSGSVFVTRTHSTSGIQSQFCPIIRCCVSVDSGRIANDVQPSTASSCFFLPSS